LAAVLISAMLASWGVFQAYSSESAYQQQYRDPYLVAAQTTRFEGFREAVPADSILGYLTDAQPGSVTSDAMFLTAQYTLAPRLLERNQKHQQVLGNFSRPADFAALGRQYGLRLDHDFGNGVVLFRTEAP
jgi:hypothetical protein